jgi:acetyltransferase-like isoleucine patch superfamily enzyme
VSSKQIEAASSKQIEAASSKQIEAASSKQIEAASSKQIEAASSKQIEAASSEQIEAMRTAPIAPPRVRGVPPIIRGGPPPLRGGLLTFLRFARANHMLRPAYLVLVFRWLWLKLRWRGRLQTDGLCFVCPGVNFQIGRNATVSLGRWSWIGHDTKIRAHEGIVSLGAKSVLGQECTISAYQHISIGRECIIADRVMMIDFDHGMVEVERPIREQGIYKRDVNVGHNVWIGYGACLLRGVTIGNNSVVGTSAVVTTNVPENAVVAGIPARLIRMREAPRTLRWG